MRLRIECFGTSISSCLYPYDENGILFIWTLYIKLRPWVTWKIFSQKNLHLPSFSEILKNNRWGSHLDYKINRIGFIRSILRFFTTTPSPFSGNLHYKTEAPETSPLLPSHYNSSQENPGTESKVRRDLYPFHELTYYDLQLLILIPNDS